MNQLQREVPHGEAVAAWLASSLQLDGSYSAAAPLSRVQSMWVLPTSSPDSLVAGEGAEQQAGRRAAARVGNVPGRLAAAAGGVHRRSLCLAARLTGGHGRRLAGFMLSPPLCALRACMGGIRAEAGRKPPPTPAAAAAPAESGSDISLPYVTSCAGSPPPQPSSHQLRGQAGPPHSLLDQLSQQPQQGVSELQGLLQLRPLQDPLHREQQLQDLLLQQQLQDLLQAQVQQQQQPQQQPHQLLDLLRLQQQQLQQPQQPPPQQPQQLHPDLMQSLLQQQLMQDLLQPGVLQGLLQQQTQPQVQLPVQAQPQPAPQGSATAPKKTARGKRGGVEVRRKEQRRLAR